MGFLRKTFFRKAFTLKEVGSSFAGHPFLGELKTGECVRIMTGGKVPEGADTVVMQEQVTAHAKEIAFPSGVKKGQNVRKSRRICQGCCVYGERHTYHASAHQLLGNFRHT